MPENVYSLDPTGLTQLKDEQGQAAADRPQPGDGVTLPDGRGLDPAGRLDPMGQAAGR